MNHIISVKDMCLWYGDHKALKEVSIEIPEKSITAFIGPSGCGKTTLLRILGGFLEADEGKVIFDGEEINFYSFYEECRDNPAFAAYPIPMLILHGQYDDYIPMSDIQLLRDLNDHSKLVIIPGASHRFLEPGAWDMVLDLTRDWFAYEQVLLAESI